MANDEENVKAPRTAAADRWHYRVQVGSPGLSPAELRNYAMHNPEDFQTRVDRLIERGDLRWEKVSDLRALSDALIDVPVKHHVPVVGSMGRTRAIESSAFPLLAGSLSVAGISAAYEQVPTIGQDLVLEIEDNKRVTHWAELLPESSTTTAHSEGVLENEDYPEVGAGERKFSIPNLKDGLRMSVTEEMAQENDVPGILQRINFMGEYMAKRIEKRTIRRVTDHDGSKASPTTPYAMYINGTGTTLYTTTADTPGTECPEGTRINNNALVDEQSLETARKHLAKREDRLGDRVAIPIARCTLLVPDSLVSTASKIVNSEYVPGVFNEVNAWGPRGLWRPRIRSSPFIDDLSTGAWYLGWFERQFVRKYKMRLTNVTLGADGQMFLQRGIVFQARVSADVEIAAVHFNYVVQCLPATTAPGDGG